MVTYLAHLEPNFPKFSLLRSPIIQVWLSIAHYCCRYERPRSQDVKHSGWEIQSGEKRTNEAWLVLTQTQGKIQLRQRSTFFIFLKFPDPFTGHLSPSATKAYTRRCFTRQLQLTAGILWGSRHWRLLCSSLAVWEYQCFKRLTGFFSLVRYTHVHYKLKTKSL